MNSGRPEPCRAEPVVAAVDRNGGHHRRVGVLEAGLPLWIVRRQGRQRGEVTARRTAGDRHEVRVAAVLGDVLLDPRQRPLHVDDVRGPGVARAHPVRHRHAHPAALGQVAHQRVGLRAAHPDRPCAAGHLQQHGCPSVAGQIGASPHVGDVDPMRSIADGAGLLHVPAPAPRRAEHTARPAAPLLRDDRFVVLAERLAQRILETGLGLGRAAVDESEHAPAERRDGQRDAAAGALEVAAKAASGGVQHRRPGHYGGCLARRPAEREHRQGDVPLAAQRLHRVAGVRQFGDRTQQRIPPSASPAAGRSA